MISTRLFSCHSELNSKLLPNIVWNCTDNQFLVQNQLFTFGQKLELGKKFLIFQTAQSPVLPCQTLDWF